MYVAVRRYEGVTDSQEVGKAADAPGQAQAGPNAGQVIDRQTANGVSAGGGPKGGTLAPTNADHFYQTLGRIGNNH